MKEDSQSKIHPGSGRRKALEFNKGRQSDDQSIDCLLYTSDAADELAV